MKIREMDWKFVAVALFGSAFLLYLAIQGDRLLPCPQHSRVYRIGIVLPDGCHRGERGYESAEKTDLALKLFAEMLRDPKSRIRETVFSALPHDQRLLEMNDQLHVPCIDFIFERERVCGDRDKDEAAAKEAAKRLVDKGDVVAVIGHMWSKQANWAKDLYVNKIPLICPDAGDPTVTDQFGVYSMGWPQERQASAIAAYVDQLVGWDAEVAVIGDDSSYGEGLAASIKKRSGKWTIFSSGKEQGIGQAVDELMEVNKGQPFAAVVLCCEGKTACDAIIDLKARKLKAPIIASDAMAKKWYAQKLDEELSRSNPTGTKTLNVLVADRSFFPEGLLVRHAFGDEFVKRWVSDPRSRENSSPSSGAKHPPELQPTYESMLFVDAAIVIVRGILESVNSPSQKDLCVDQMRQALFNYLNQLVDNPPEWAKERERRTVQGLTGPLTFDSQRFLDRPIYFSRIVEGELDPALEQISNVSCANQGDIRPPKQSFHKSQQSQKRVVRVGADFIRVSNLDLKRQQFDAELLVWFKWTGEDPFGSKRNERWFHFLNGLYTQDEQVYPILSRPVIGGPDGGESYNTRVFRAKKTFVTDYRLDDFPFDTQNLNVDIALSFRDDFILVPDRPFLCENKELLDRIYQREYHLRPDWKNVEMARKPHVGGLCARGSSAGLSHTSTQSGAAKQMAVYRAGIELERAPTGYSLKMLIPLAFLLAISFSGYFLLEHLDVRIALTVTTLLTTIVLHLATTSQLPEVGYPMLADYLVLVAYGVMTINILMALVYEVYRKSNPRSAVIANWVIASGSFWVWTILSLWLTSGKAHTEAWYGFGVAALVAYIAAIRVTRFVKRPSDAA